MLGKNADAFFTTPMRTRVTMGGNQAAASMPAPRVANGRAVPTMPGIFGMGDDATPQAQVTAVAQKGTITISPLMMALGAGLVFWGFHKFTRGR
jgi:hypothetical protein